MGKPARNSGILDVTRDLLGGTVVDDDQQAFRDATNDVNRRRLRVLLPLMAVVHLVHVAIFFTGDAQRATLDPVVAQWRDGLTLTHLATALAAIPLAIVAWRPFNGARSLLAPVAGAVWLLHAAAICGVDQLVVKNVAVFMGYSLGVAVVLAATPPQSIALYAFGWVAVTVAVFTQQSDPALRTQQVMSASSAVVVGFVLQSLLASARRRDFSQSRTIEKQRADLTALNEGLERRVHEQVGEIVKRAEEVSTLNAQLQAQVRARSSDLTLALSRLAFRHDLDGKLPEGTLLGERFEVRSALGEGGMGKVYAGVDKSTNAPVAIKVIQATSARHLDAMKRFLAEAANVATIVHPAVVRMIHVDISQEGMLFQAQELVEGTSLGALMGTQPVPAPVVTRIGAVLAEALAAAHAQGIVHRDVKPDNIMLTRGAPGLKLLDFGIAKLAEGELSGPGDDDTKSGVVVGTPSYMAPEQVESGPVTDRTDVYALGVLLFRLASGRLPFLGITGRARMMKRLLEDAPDLRTLVPGDESKDLADLVAQCLRRDPASRPSAAELAPVLARCADRMGAPSLENAGIERVQQVRGEETPETTADVHPEATVSMSKRRPGSSEMT